MYTGVYAREDVVTTNPHLVARLRMRGTVSRLTHMPSFSDAELNTETTFCFVVL